MPNHYSSICCIKFASVTPCHERSLNNRTSHSSSPEEPFTGWIVWGASFAWHRILWALHLRLICNGKNWMCILPKKVGCAIKHSIHQLCIWFTANISCYWHIILAIDNRRCTSLDGIDNSVTLVSHWTGESEDPLTHSRGGEFFGRQFCTHAGLRLAAPYGRYSVGQ